jgi:hypothetical protein
MFGERDIVVVRRMATLYTLVVNGLSFHVKLLVVYFSQLYAETTSPTYQLKIMLPNIQKYISAYHSALNCRAFCN